MSMPGPAEIIIISLVIILMFGSKIFVGWAKGMGQTIKEVKKAKKEF